MRICITGAKGLIGSYLTAYILSRATAEVRLLLRGLSGPAEETRAEVIQGDLISPSDCERFASGLDVIYYLAHCNTPVNSDLDQPRDALINLVPFLTFLRAVQSLRTRPHIVYFSTGGAIYGPKADRIPFRETDPLAPCCSYGIQKLAAEQYLRVAAERGYVTATVLRVGNAYGAVLPQHRLQGLIGVALGNLAHGRPIRIFGDAENVRDYIQIEDVSSIAWAAARPRTPFDIINVGSGEGHSVRQVLDIIASYHQRPLQIESVEKTACSSWLPSWVVLDITKASREFGWTPAITFGNGIARMVAQCSSETRTHIAFAQECSASPPL